MTNGIIEKDGKWYIMCGDKLVEIRFVPLKGNDYGQVGTITKTHG